MQNVFFLRREGGEITKLYLPVSKKFRIHCQREVFCRRYIGCSVSGCKWKNCAHSCYVNGLSFPAIRNRLYNKFLFNQKFCFSKKVSYNVKYDNMFLLSTTVAGLTFPKILIILFGNN